MIENKYVTLNDSSSSSSSSSSSQTYFIFQGFNNVVIRIYDN